MNHPKWIAVAILVITATGAITRAAGFPAPGPTATPQNNLTPASNALLEKLQTELHKMKSLQADFTEVMTPKNGKKPQEFTGYLAATEPDHVIYIVKTPYPTAVRVLGEDLRVWTADPNDEKAKGDIRTINLAGNSTYKSVAQQSRDWAGGNFKRLAESYDVFIEHEGPLELRFVPKPRTGLTSVFTSASITLTDDYRSVQRIIYRKTNGETYNLALSNVKVNQEIPHSTWDFPPKP